MATFAVSKKRLQGKGQMCSSASLDGREMVVRWSEGWDNVDEREEHVQREGEDKEVDQSASRGWLDARLVWLVGWLAAGRGGGALLDGLGLIESETLNPTRKRPWQHRRPHCQLRQALCLSLCLASDAARERGRNRKIPPKIPTIVATRAEKGGATAAALALSPRLRQRLSTYSVTAERKSCCLPLPLMQGWQRRTTGHSVGSCRRHTELFSIKILRVDEGRRR